MTCTKQSTKKYVTRPSPAYPANASGCRGSTKKGNDGAMYKSVKNKSGVYTWRRKSSSAKAKPKRKSSIKRKSGKKVSQYAYLEGKTHLIGVFHSPDKNGAEVHYFKRGSANYKTFLKKMGVPNAKMPAKRR